MGLAVLQGSRARLDLCKAWLDSKLRSTFRVQLSSGVPLYKSSSVCTRELYLAQLHFNGSFCILEGELLVSFCLLSGQWVTAHALDANGYS